jgi:hypothetical protein
MRKCRYRPCRREFLPPKPNYYFCCYEHCQRHYAEHDYRGYQRSGDQHYDRGFWDGARAQPPGQSSIPSGIWKGMLLFCHPDKHEQEPGLKTLADEITRWLLDHRPVERN